MSRAIFISYRRSSSAGTAGRLYDAISARFGHDRVFMDVDTLTPGRKFGPVLVDTLKHCKAVLVVIDKSWLSVTDQDGERRLDKPGDYVRLEIEQAVAAGANLFPLLVDGAAMPSSKDLPESLRPLADWQATEISSTRFRYDTARLIEALEQTLGDAQVQPPLQKGPPAQHPIPRRTRVLAAMSRRTKLLVASAVVVVAASAVGLLLGRSELVGQDTPEPSTSVTPATSSPPASPPPTPRTAVPQAAVPLSKNVIVWPGGTTGKEDIWTVRDDGAERKLLVGNPGTDTWPVISHDRKTVLYVHIDEGGQSLRIVSADGKGDRVFADVGSICEQLISRPAWSSTGMIAVVCVEGERNHSIKLVNLDGTLKRTLIPGGDYIEDPTFSNDGKLVVYWKEPSTNELTGGPLYQIGVNGKQERRITDGKPGQDADPAWSPDDDRIAFRRRDDRGGAFDIWIHNVRTGESKALVTGPSNDQDPSWSPDGERIVYKCGPSANADICIVDADGSHLHRLIEGDEPDTAPAWTPR